MSVTFQSVHITREFSERHVDPVELPCKDMDPDCLPDEFGSVPFGDYRHCYAYDPKKGLCPFLPIHTREL